jgi:Transposase IS66 family
VSKFADHQPLYRLEGILERADVRIPRSTLGQWSGACGVELSPLAQAMKVALLSRSVLHADETPVPMLKPGLGHTHRAYLWSYGTTQFDPLPLVLYDFAESRGGHLARAFLGAWSGKLVCDDFSGYKALFERGVIEIGCMAHYPEDPVIWSSDRRTAVWSRKRRPVFRIRPCHRGACRDVRIECREVIRGLGEIGGAAVQGSSIPVARGCASLAA